MGGRKIEIMIANVPATCRVEIRAVKAITFVAVYLYFLSLLSQADRLLYRAEAC